MKNQDTPVNPHPQIERPNSEHVPASTGETKRENAFWMDFSSMLGHPDTECSTYDVTAEFAIKAVNAGFKALESPNE